MIRAAVNWGDIWKRVAGDLNSRRIKSNQAPTFASFHELIGGNGVWATVRYADILNRGGRDVDSPADLDQFPSE